MPSFCLPGSFPDLVSKAFFRGLDRDQGVSFSRSSWICSHGVDDQIYSAVGAFFILVETLPSGIFSKQASAFSAPARASHEPMKSKTTRARQQRGRLETLCQ